METLKKNPAQLLRDLFDKSELKKTATGMWPSFSKLPEGFLSEFLNNKNTGEILLSLIPEYPKHVYVLNRYLGTGNGFEVVPPELFIEKIHTIKETPAAWSIWSDEIISSLTYRFKYQESFSNFIMDRIHNLKNIPTYKAFEIIDIVQGILFSSKGNSYADENINSIKKLFNAFYQDVNNPFLEREYVNQMIIESTEQYIPDEGPIKIAKDTYAFDEEFGWNDSSFF